MNNQYVYNERAVAFLDVLGFKSKLDSFEKEAIEFKENQENNVENDRDSFDSLDGVKFYSAKANEFIDTFNSAISKLNPDNFRYYLFSDNICINARNDTSENSSLIELLLIISELYYEFAQKGYFLRGGIDYGLFIDDSSLALGVPLVNAYNIESVQAVFPRILLSNNFVKQFELYLNADTTVYSSILLISLIKKSCEINYLNIFNHIFKVDYKEDFFVNYNSKIIENIKENESSEKVSIKFKWLANEFNNFIDSYTSSLAYLDENFEPTDEFISNIKQLKIDYGY